MEKSPHTRMVVPLLAVPCLLLAATGAVGQTGSAWESVRGGSAAEVVPGQEGYTYLVRDAERPSRPGPAAGDLPELEFATDPRPMRVLQGAAVTWVVPAGEAPALATAELVLLENVPVREGRGSLLVRGWPVAGRDAGVVELELVRGAEDRTVAGRRARHYVLLARLEPANGEAGVARRVRVTSHFWILPELPFSWAPFGVGAQSLPEGLPLLREALEPRLDTLGLVARAVTQVDVERVSDGATPGAGGAGRVAGFEISALERHAVPPLPGVVVDRSITEALERLARRRPLRVCREARDGILPATVRSRVGDELHARLTGYVSAACQDADLYVRMMEERLMADPEGVCRHLRYAYDPRRLAERILTDAQATAFAEMLSRTQREAVHDRLRASCPP